MSAYSIFVRAISDNTSNPDEFKGPLKPYDLIEG